MMTEDPSDLRDNGLTLLEKGKDYFNKHQAIEQREKGYEFYKQGLQYIVKYLKAENNEAIAKKMKDHFNNWMQEAKAMDATIQTIKKNTQHQRNIHANKPTVPAVQPFYQEKTGKENTMQPFSRMGVSRRIDPQDHNSNSNNYNNSPVPQQQGGRPESQPQNQNQSQAQPKPQSSDKAHRDGKPKKMKESNGDNTKLQNNLEGAIVSETPNVKWDDIAGLAEAKNSLMEAVIYPIKFPHLFIGMRTPWKGILLYGPPGTGKTYLAKACATEASATFFSVSAADLTSKYVGESEKLIKILFKMAREKKPSIIFIDEIDSLLSARSDNENEATRRVKTEFLVQMEGVGQETNGILVLGATNIPWGLDTAVRRRFEKRIYIPLPEKPARLALLQKQMAKTPNNLNEEDLVYIAERTEGFSGADMNILVRDASYEPFRKAQNATHFKKISMTRSGKPAYEPCAPSDPNGERMDMHSLDGEQLVLPPITVDDFEVSLMKIKPTVGESDLVKQQEFTRMYGMEG